MDKGNIQLLHTIVERYSNIEERLAGLYDLCETGISQVINELKNDDASTNSSSSEEERDDSEKTNLKGKLPVLKQSSWS